MRRTIILAALAALALAPAAQAQPADREVTLDGGIAPLHGALLVPERRSTGAAILMLEGSGDVDRDGDSAKVPLKRSANKHIAEGLAAAGVVTLRIDKRCIGESQLACPGEEKLRPQTYVDDAVAWANFLRARPGVRCVIIYGHSEGALIADLAAARTPVCGVVSAAGAGRPLDVIIHAQMIAHGASTTTLAKVDEIQAALKAGRAVPDVPPMLLALYRPAVQPYLTAEMNIDPAAAAKAVRAPMLILQGVKDERDSVADARLLAAAQPSAQLLLLPEGIHSLQDWHSPTAPDFDQVWPVDPAVVPAIAAFARKVGGPAAP